MTAYFLPSNTAKAVDWWASTLSEEARNMAGRTERFSMELSGVAAEISKKMPSFQAILTDMGTSARTLNNALGVFSNVTAYIHPALLSVASRASFSFLNLSILRSFFTFYAGINVVRQDVSGLSEAYENNDVESGVAYGLHTGFGAGLLAIAPASLITSLAKLPIAAAAALPATVAGLIVSGSGIALNVFLGLYGIQGLVTARQFINGLKEGSDQEIDKMYDNLKDSITNLNQIKRWVGPKAIPLLMDKLGVKEEADLVGALQAEEAALKKEEILNIIFEHNYKTQAKYVGFILIAAVGIAAFIAGLVLTGGLANITFLLFALSSVLWLSFDSNSLSTWITDRVWEWRKDSVLPDELKTAFITLSEIPQSNSAA